MGGFGCPCGSGFKDYTPDQAQLVSMQDWEYFMETAEASMLNIAWHFVKATVYQCPSCSRLHIHIRGGFDHSSKALGTYTFTPDDKESAGILRSIYGKKWKRTLRAVWEDSPGKGYVYWGSAYPGGEDEDDDNGEIILDVWQDVEKLYYEVFQRLKNADKLGMATLRRNNNEIVHTWEWRPFWRKE